MSDDAIEEPEFHDELGYLIDEVSAQRRLITKKYFTTFRNDRPTDKKGHQFGGSRSNPPYGNFVFNLDGLIYVTDVHVYAHDRVGNVTKAILRAEANGVALTPDWQDVKKDGAWEFYATPTGEGIRASRIVFTSHHKGHKSGDDETVMQAVLVYGY